MKYLLILLALTSCGDIEHYSEMGEMICYEVNQGKSGKCIYNFTNGKHSIELATKCGNYNIGDTLQ